MNDATTAIFTDGSSRGNPGPGGFGAVVVHDGRIVELGGGERNTTNNRMELSALIEALKILPAHQSGIAIYTDSRYAINGITKWVLGWKQNGWMTKAKEPVLNKDLWQELVAESENRGISWNHVEGHVGVVGNERADKIATAFADGETVDLFNGPQSQYRLDVSRVDVDTSKLKEKKRRSGKAFSYLSLVDGEVMRHETWAECESRVKGRTGVKFRKALSLQEEKRIIDEWRAQGL